eukprot:jgi/Undpi1/13312/HiC_scaffold_8.g02973.m1
MDTSQTSIALATQQTQAPTKASVVVDLRPFSELKTRFKKLDVDRTGRIAALANSKVLLVYDLENPDKVRHQNFIPYKRELQHVNAVRWNPHHHCRMHLASAKGREVIVWRLEDAAATGVTGETILRQHTNDVSDISWSQQDEHLLVSASHSIFSWDTRAQAPVQEWKVPGALTSHVSFNRKNAHLLASSFQNQVCIWDLRKVQKPVLTIPAHLPKDTVTSIDWSHESLDDADHLRLHDIEEPDHRSAGVDLPAGDSSTWKDYGSTAGSESLEGVSTSKAPALRDDIVPVVWSFSRLQSAATSKMMIETAGDDPLRELMQVEKLANRGRFGSISNVLLDAAQKSVSLVMLASAEARGPPSANLAQVVRTRGGIDTGVADALTPNVSESDMTKYVAAARLRVTAKLPQGHRSRDEHAGIQLESDGGYVLVTPSDPSSTTDIQDPLDDATLKRMRAAAGEIMHQALKSRQSRLQACLFILRRDLEERVRDVANHVAGVLPGDDFVDRQEGGPRDMTPGAEMAMAQAEEPIVPCPRRFGATFAPNGSLVVFCSALAVVRARTDEGRKSGERTRKQTPLGYPRTYASLLDCLQKAQRVDMEEDSQGDDAYPPHFDDLIRDDESRSWFRSSWGYNPDHVWEGEDDGTFDVERYSTEESFVEEDEEAPTSRDQGDSTRLPISHPDHSLGAGLGTQSDNDAVERETDEDTTVATDSGIEGELPWTPKPKEVVLVDCSRFLPGSVYLAAFYKLGPLRPPVRRKEARGSITDPSALASRKDTVEDKIDVLFGPLTVDSSTRADFGAGSDISVSSGGRSRRNSLVFGSSLGISTGLPPPLSIIQRGVSATQDSVGRGGGGLTRRPSVELVQTSELADVAEFPLREPGVNITPPRSQAFKEDGQMFSGGAVVGGDAGMFSPGTGLARKPAAQSRNMHLTRKGSVKMRQNYPLPRSPCSSCGPSPPIDAPRLRLAGLNPASPADPTGPASSSPPMSDFGMDLGHASVPTVQIASNPAPPLGRGSRSSSFCAGGGVGGGGGASLGFGELGGGDGAASGLPGLSVRGHPSGSGDYTPDAVHASGNRSRSGTDLWRGGTPRASRGSRTTVDEGEANIPLRPSIGHLSRHNAAVATVSGRGELASFWALMADAADKGAEGEAATGQVGSRCFPSWKSTGPRLINTIFSHFETRRDPQMLASIACVLGSGSTNEAAAEKTQQEEEEKAATYDRYLACYAERLYQWGAQGVMAEATSHQTGAFGGHRSATQGTEKFSTRQRRNGMVAYLCSEQGGDEEPHGPFHCSVCYKAVDGEHLSCRLCGHGGHSTHIENWFRDETECSHELCSCRCLEEMTTREEID